MDEKAQTAHRRRKKDNYFRLRFNDDGGTVEFETYKHLPPKEFFFAIRDHLYEMERRFRQTERRRREGGERP